MKTLFILFSFFPICLFSQQFEKVVITETAHGFTSIASGDIDGDGDLDIVGSSRWEHKIVWFDNLGSGDFGSIKVITDSATVSREIQLVDVDMDGDLDVIGAMYGIDKVSWFENDGLGNFISETVITDTLDGAMSVFVSDLDGDLDLDLVCAGLLGNEIVVYENIGGLYSNGIVLTTAVNGPWSVYVEDLDGDGLNDILSASEYDDKVAWYKNQGSFNFGSQQVLSVNANGARTVYAMDFDQDGDMDVLAANYYDDNVIWFENLGSGTFATEVVFAAGIDGATDVTASDVDGDGDLDVLTTSYDDKSVRLFENLGLGMYAMPLVLANNISGAQTVITADVTGSGFRDVFVGDYNWKGINWFENSNGTINLSMKSLFNTLFSNYIVESADIDGDGLLDILTASEGPLAALGWYKNLGDGIFSSDLKQLASTTGQIKSVKPADVDLDGDVDVIVANFNGDEVFYHENLGGGLFAPEVLLSGNINGPDFIQVKDVSGDGYPEIFTLGYFDDEVFMFTNLTNGSFGTEVSVASIGGSATDFKLEDLNVDGFLDIVYADGAFNKISWFEGSASATFGVEQVITSVIDNPSSLALNDMDGDLLLDIIATSEDDDEVVWYKNLGAGNFGVKQVISTGLTLSPQSVVASDIDLDGDLDVVVASEDNNKVSWFENLSGSFSSENIMDLNTLGALYVSVIDIDGDGDEDVLSASIDDSRINLFINTEIACFYSLNAEICQGDSYNFNGVILTDPGVYRDTIPSVACDSIFELNLVVHPIFTSVVHDTICDGDSLLFQGQSFDVAGSYDVVYTSLQNCDSVFTLELFVKPLPVVEASASDSSVSTNEIVYFYGSGSTGDSFSWNFGDGTLSSNLNESHAFSSEGYYPVVLTSVLEGCENTDTIMMNVSGFLKLENLNENDLRVYPNPSNGLITLELESNHDGSFLLEVVDVNGRTVFFEPLTFNNNASAIDLSHLDDGAYYLKIEKDEVNYSSRLILLK